MTEWSNLASVVYKRTYARQDLGPLENWEDTVERVIEGNIRGHNVSDHEKERLRFFMKKRKGGPAGRGLWFSGSPAHLKIGGVALNNCWGLVADDWKQYVIAQDLLMLGGGVGMSVESEYVRALPKIKKGVQIVHKPTNDADFIVPDSREGWCELLKRVLEAFFDTGKSFSYSTVCIRGHGEKIKGFGGKASGPLPLIDMVAKISALLHAREGKKMRPIDAGDLLCIIAEMVVSGNVRRSALMLLGDPWDKDFLRAKRWDLGILPSYRSNANYSVVCDDVEDLHPLFWKSYEIGEAYGVVNRKNMQTYGRMGEKMPDSAVVVNPCVPGDTEILTSEGYRRIDSLVGQNVKVWNGFEWSTVAPQVTGYNQPMVTVTLSSGQRLRCTEAHRFVTVAADGSPVSVLAKDLRVGAKLIKTEMPVISSGESAPYAYSQGFLSGDGTDGSRVFSLYEPKYMCASRLDASIGSECNGRRYVRLNFEPHAKDFVPFGWDLTSRLDWLAGLLDSDGTELKEGGAQISSVDETFLLDTQKMLTTLGVTSKVRLSHPEMKKSLPDGRGGERDYSCQRCYRLIIGAAQMQKLKSLGLRCERLTFNKAPNRDASRFVTVVDVRGTGVEDVVYCFTEPLRHLGCFEGVVTGQCGEATLEDGEPCNLLEIALNNLESEDEFEECARLLFRYGKRVTCERYHHAKTDQVIKRNRRVGIGLTGCLISPLFRPEVLDRVYAAVIDEDKKYSAELGVPESIRHTTMKPSGTMGKVFDTAGYEGLHAAYSRYMIQRVRFASDDAIVPLLRDAGHKIEPVMKLDGTADLSTVVVDFYVAAPDGAPCADEDFDTWRQLEVVKMVQKHWADQSVSVTVYYKREDIPKIKEWFKDNLSEIKTISFLCHSEHGFAQAPKEAITKEQYEKLSANIRPIDVSRISRGDMIDGMECAGGVCPVR